MPVQELILFCFFNVLLTKLLFVWGVTQPSTIFQSYHDVQLSYLNVSSVASSNFSNSTVLGLKIKEGYIKTSLGSYF